MKVIEIKDGAKTKIKVVPDDWEETTPDLPQGDLTTSGRKSIGFLDINKDRWDNIFKK